ncbi:hypothetical protein QBC47DRAFT_294069 [Echria macrotheca]|uniref:CST complex subunit STN1 n=1 Tax=Echria macrotheca TaxID=438768 RepID=A0AAJ0FFY2_9PEZI|nr:hypothetical protein QBC47DRAFT_294069 [Echria macrotheca]
MTSVGQTPEIYPQYCFHLSPTIQKWCHLRASDILALSAPPEFEGQDLFFYINHPIKWVRVSGIVVAIDEFGAWRAYTIDDSSGVTIECHIPAPKKPDGINPATEPTNQQQNQPNAGLVDADIDIGDIIDVKGGIKVFRDMRHIKAEKIVHLRSTEQEVQFWEKLIKLRKEILDQPWVLDKRVVRKCRKEAEGIDASSRTRKDKQDRHDRGKSSTTVAAAVSGEGRCGGKSRTDDETGTAAEKPKARVTGLERKPKRVKRPVSITGKYDALGL